MIGWRALINQGLHTLSYTMQCVLIDVPASQTEMPGEERKANFQIGDDSEDEVIGTEEKGVQTEAVDSDDIHISRNNVDIRSLEECLAIFKSDVSASRLKSLLSSNSFVLIRFCFCKV